MGYPNFPTDAARAIDAVVSGDHGAIDQALARLNAPELEALRASAVFLAECCEIAARTRS